jgi:hypothetical protein
VPANYVLLAEQTVSATVASVTFSNIPQTGYTDLVIKCSVRSNQVSAYEAMKVIYNGVTSSYGSRQLYGDGTSATSNTYSDAWAGFINAAGSTTNTFTSTEIYIPNYTSSTFKPSSVNYGQENNATQALAGMLARLWSNTAAINSLTFTCEAGSFVANSTFSVYGVAALEIEPVVAPKAAGGDIIVNDGTYWYHAFLSSGVFRPTQAISCDALVVAGGGGGGGGGSGGGGGAGGVFVPNTQSLTATNYVVTVGAGGQGDSSYGSNSQFGVLTAALGGGGGAAPNGNNGGSGGGSYPGGTGGSATQTSTGGTGYGNAGGNGAAFSPPYASGGGGGSGSAGTAGSGSTTGAGGAGRNTWSSWLSATGLGVSGFIAGGGGGGANQQYPGASAGIAGSGGGGTGGISGGTGTAGVINTGSGGGGSSTQPGGSGTGPAGGSGLVIVRYLMATA